jgi:hypothetical protein
MSEANKENLNQIIEDSKRSDGKWQTKKR